MGKGEDKPAEETEKEIVADSPAGEEEKPETTDETPPKTEEKKEEEPADEKKDVDSLRKVIKVDQTEEKKEEKPAESDKNEEKKAAEPVKDDTSEETDPLSSKESLEQKRAILQNIKDFDFQIKKNQEELGSLNKKIDGMSKDLDDLVSLYEIVSEQMNPFVGLSKVTKKRLDALESFTREIEVLKERTGELESFAERSGAKIQRLREGAQKVKTIDTDAILAQMDGKAEEGKEGEEKEGENPEESRESGEKISEEGKKEVETEGEKKGKEKAVTTTSEEKLVEETSEKKEVDKEDSEEISKVEEEDEDISHEEVPSEEILLPTPPTEVSEDIFDSDIFGDMSTEITLEPMPADVRSMDDSIFDESYDMDLDMIFEIAFSLLSASAKGKIDMIIDEFIESLKG